MNYLFLTVSLAIGIGFAFLVPAFFSWVAAMNESFGYPTFQRALPAIFRVGSWFFAVASCVGLANIVLAKEGRLEILVDTISGALLAWRLRCGWRRTLLQQTASSDLKQPNKSVQRKSATPQSTT
jgi:hypothetical protein